ncbi:hypothetical protein HJC23_007547 [Cyclotella cryptica]|uniref:AB hydrolase-1 domain-containing protein n=1 Tax=Cyclotella cryptica TaxID=29204 RepID=A0ABD3QXK1_9STRA|eukprot:CCRYP_002815-RD/>CCRYP_002815-RD protein AED:0.04 eAED:0.04 QI:173/1/1/1/1/1/4/115/716
MPFTTDSFLDALALPSEHPYVTDDVVASEELKEWSISDYFGSVSSSSSRLRPSDECPKFSPPPWMDGVAGVHRDLNKNSLNDDNISFLEEIRPCLISMCRMAIILWAPLVLFLCLKRLSRPHAKHASDRKPPLNDSISFEKLADNRCLLGVHVMGKNPFSKAPCSSQTSSSCIQHNTTVDRFLFIISLVANFVSFLCATTPFFSIEDQQVEQDSNLPASKHTHPCKSNQCYFTLLGSSTIGTADHDNCCGHLGDWLAYVTALVFSAIIVTDAMYVFEFSRNTLIFLHLLVIFIAMKRLGPKAVILVALPISSSLLSMMRYQDLDLPSIQPGLYYDESNPIISKAVHNYWPIELRTYNGGTPWMITGDVRTGLPFLLYSPPGVEYIRRWVPLPEENEAVILDIALPESGVIEENKAVYLVLHGINGHSNEGYVRDFVRQQIAEGNIVAVIVTRGLMDSPILGKNLPHFARISDVSAAAKALKAAILNMRDISSSSLANRPILSGVGYSMGAITLANYVARSGKDCNLDVAIGFSGALDTREQESFARSASLWQPFIAKAMRDTLLRKFMRQIEQKFNREQFLDIMKAKSLIDLDRAFFAPYNNFESLDDYYSNTGAMGDFISFNGKEGRIANVSIPLCMVQSLDDPVGTWRSFHDPQKVATTGNGSTLILFTRTGGHVGWPLGMNPRIHGWSWMGDVAASFVDAIRQARTDVIHGIV